MGRGLALDVRLSLRALAAARSVSIPAILSLALAIGANVCVFAVVNSLLLRPLPVAEPERLASVTSEFAIGHGFTAGAGWSLQMWEALRARAAVFDGVLAWTGQRFTLGAPGDTESVSGMFVSGEFFETLGVAPRRGRMLTVEDDRAGAAVAVISSRLWRRRFAGSADAIGAHVLIDGAQATVIGVAPESFLGLEVGTPFDVALPIGAEAAIRGAQATLHSGRQFGLLIMVRLAPGQSIEAGARALGALQPEIVGPGAPAFVKNPFALIGADGTASGPASPRRVFRRPMLIMLGGVALVLAIACVNIANLLLARAIARRRELGVRLALGASRWDVVRPVMLESLLVAAGGGVLGLILATWGVRALVARSPLVLDVSFDWRVFAFTAAIVLATGLASGLVPSRRAAGANVAESLRAGSAAVVSRARLLDGLVVVQIALALVVVIAAGLFARTLAQLAGQPLGFDADRVLVVSGSLARVRPDQDGRTRLYRQLTDAARAVPGVEAAAASSWTPLTGSGAVIGIARPGAPPGEGRIDVLANFITPGWFSAYGTPLVAGRDFGTQDTAASPRVVIVNEAFARRLLPAGQSVGATIDGNLVVGVVGNAVYRTTRLVPGVTSLALREPPAPTIYAPLAQAASWDRPPASSIRVSVRAARGSPQALARSVAAALTAVEPRLTLESRPLAQDVDASLAQERLTASASSFFGAFSLLLAALGIYGVTSYTNSRRTREIAVRLALGATPVVIRQSIVARAMLPVGLGIALGLAGAVIAARYIASLLFGVAPLDPATVGGVCLVMVVTAAAAAVLPARRACRIDPWRALRTE